MRRRFTAVATETAQVDLAPLVDVIFLLLIFFILTATFIQESGVTIDRPRHSAAENVGGRYLPVTITREGLVFVGDQEVDEVSPAGFVQAFAGSEERHVLVRSDRSVSAGLLLSVMDCCQQAGAVSVQVAAEP